MMKNILIVFMLLGLSSASLDLRRSIERIQDQINVTKQPGTTPDWKQLPVIIEMAMPCLSSLESFEVNSDRLPRNLEEYIKNITPAQFAEQLLNVNWEAVSAKRSEIQPKNIWEELKEFMKTEQFETIHKHIWEDVEFLDLVGYLHDSNYAEIYVVIKAFYEAMERKDLADDLPSEPPVYLATQRKQGARRAGPKTSSHNFPMITMKSGIFKQAAPECNLAYLLQVLQTLNASHIQEVIKVFLYMFQEFIGNAAVHVLCLKIGETQKGEFFHNTLALPEMEQFFPLVQGGILQEPAIAQLNEILRQVTGLDLANLELFKYITDLIQYLVWNYPFPATEEA